MRKTTLGDTAVLGWWNHQLLICSILLLIFVSCEAKDQYLYRTLENDGGRPIIDYYSPQADNNYNDRPDFLYQKDFPYHRVVEFYSHLCPHCQNFAPHYIEFGRHFEELVSRHTQGHYANLEVKFYAISCFVHRTICKRERIRGYPTVRVYKAKSTRGIKLPYYELHTETLVKKLGIESVKEIDWKEAEQQLEQEQEEQQQQQAAAATTTTTEEEQPETQIQIQPQTQTQTQQEQSEQREKPAFLPRKSTELFGDAYLSFHTSMKQGVFLDDTNQLSEEKSKALKAWLTLLQRVLPPWRIHSLLESLLKGGNPDQEQQNFTASIESEEKWMNLLDQYPPKNSEYSAACQLHDSPYTCGLWTLFHIVSVGVVEFNAAIVNHDANRYVILNMHSVTKILRDFVQHFLLCNVCTNHFLEEYDACAYNRCNRFPPEKYTGQLQDWKQLPLWLLETHNGVNIRLQRERMAAGDADATTNSNNKPSPAQQQSVMWPPYEDCPGCWLQRLGAISAKQYNETMMHNYLRLTYWPEDTDSLIAKEDLLRLQRPGGGVAAAAATTTMSGSNLDSMASVGTKSETAATTATTTTATTLDQPNLDSTSSAAATATATAPDTAEESPRSHLAATETNKETSADHENTAAPAATTTKTTTMNQTSSSTAQRIESKDTPVNPYNLSVISKEMQYSMIIMLVVVVLLWNKKRIRQKLARRMI